MYIIYKLQARNFGRLMIFGKHAYLVEKMYNIVGIKIYIDIEFCVLW